MSEELVFHEHRHIQEHLKDVALYLLTEKKKRWKLWPGPHLLGNGQSSVFFYLFTILFFITIY